MYYKDSSLTLVFQVVSVLVKDTKLLVYKLTLINAEIRILRVANEALSKCRRAKKKQIRSE